MSVGRSSRRKGKVGEREAAKLLGGARNARGGLSDEDLALPPNFPYCVEVKRRKKQFTGIYKVIEQARSYNENKPPMGLVRDDRKEWLVILRLEDFYPELDRRRKSDTESEASPASPEQSNNSTSDK